MTAGKALFFITEVNTYFSPALNIPNESRVKYADKGNYRYG